MTNVELFLQNATLEADNKNLVQQASDFQDRLRSLEHQNNKLQSQISSNQVLLQWGKFSQHNIKKKRNIFTVSASVFSNSYVTYIFRAKIVNCNHNSPKYR